MDFGPQFDWLPDTPGDSVLSRASRSVIGRSPSTMQREMSGQPQTGTSQGDVTRRTYGFYNAEEYQAPSIQNSFLRPDNTR